jgi:hypothetical protein
MQQTVLPKGSAHGAVLLTFDTRYKKWLIVQKGSIWTFPFFWREASMTTMDTIPGFLEKELAVTGQPFSKKFMHSGNNNKGLTIEWWFCILDQDISYSRIFDGALYLDSEGVIEKIGNQIERMPLSVSELINSKLKENQNGRQEQPPGPPKSTQVNPADAARWGLKQ